MTRRIMTAAAASALAGLMGIHAAYAGPKVEFGDNQWASFGAGMRTSFTTGNNNKGSDFSLDSIRLFINGEVYENIGFQFDTEKHGDNIIVLDAIVKFTLADEFHVWAGRMLPPSDRSNLDGPYYLSIWSFPSVQYYPGKVGRDDGVTIWGDVAGGVVSYSFGAFSGGKTINPGGVDSGGIFNTPGASAHKPMFAARLQVNLLDPEGGYYTQSDYYGAKDLLSIGASIQYQADATGTTVDPGDYTAWNIDAIFQKKFDIGVPSLEGSYYHYSTDSKVSLCPAGSWSCLVSGKGWFVLGSFLFPQEIGIGKFQPVVRYQKMDFDTFTGSPDQKFWDVGLNYIIKEHNVRIGLLYTNTKTVGANSDDKFTIGLQAQF